MLHLSAADGATEIKDVTMSAYLVGEWTMNFAVEAILAGGGKFAGIDCSRPRAGTTIGRKLYALNRDALLARYSAEKVGDEGLMEIATYRYTQPRDDQANHSAYDFAGMVRARRNQRLSELAYQCSEGDVTDTKLFKALDAALKANPKNKWPGDI